MYTMIYISISYLASVCLRRAAQLQPVQLKWNEAYTLRIFLEKILYQQNALHVGQMPQNTWKDGEVPECLVSDSTCLMACGPQLP